MLEGWADSCGEKRGSGYCLRQRDLYRAGSCGERELGSEESRVVVRVVGRGVGG